MSWSKALVMAALAAALVLAGMWIGERRAGRADQARPAPTPVATPALARRDVEARPSRPLRAPPTPSLAGASADLRDPDPHIRSAALRELAETHGANREVLLAASRDPDPSTAGVAIDGLARMYADGEIEADDLSERALDHSLDPKVRNAALNGLAHVPTAQTASLLADLLAHGDAVERQTAAVLLRSQDLAIAMPALIEALADPDPGVRLNAHASLTAHSRGRDFGEDQGPWRAWWQSVR